MPRASRRWGQATERQADTLRFTSLKHDPLACTSTSCPRCCKWRALPADFPPGLTDWGFLARWTGVGVIGQIRDHLRGRIRRDLGKAPRAVAT
ncbi:hypothetical protein WKI68_24240 [Streptomyces sp. MS1.HAVA.3]|uniref:Transposase n=1 Tax=Streptomyces caledonius TaxID=3134107 RepID=A0ABU8U7V6_9ACTN